LTKIKINGELSPALFKYTPPADARIVDMTKGIPDTGGKAKDAPKTSPTK
jgi:hypothetical protein